MPRFYFDFLDGSHSSPDNDPTELATIRDAQHEAVRTLAEMAKDAFPKSTNREFVMVVRDENREALLTATMSLKVEMRA